jgi:AAA+ ATPase superfamily predicted ATPase
MFIARKSELAKLERLYKKDEFQLVIIYGRRRVGKTALIREFCKDKKTIFFIGREASDKLNLDAYSSIALNTLSETENMNLCFNSWDNLFNYIGSRAKNERIILVIDEYQYLEGSNRAISSILQAHIDTHFKDSKLFMILHSFTI